MTWYILRPMIGGGSLLAMGIPVDRPMITCMKISKMFNKWLVEIIFSRFATMRVPTGAPNDFGENLSLPLDPFGADFAGKPDMPRKAPRKAAGERLESWYPKSDFRFKRTERLPRGSKNSTIYRFVKYVDNIPAK